RRDGRVKNRSDNANERLRSKSTRFVAHPLQISRARAVSLEPLLILSPGNRAFTSPTPRRQFLPRRFEQFFGNAIRREQYLTDSALGRFAQRLFLFFQQLQFLLVLLQFQQLLLERSDMPMGRF